MPPKRTPVKNSPDSAREDDNLEVLKYNREKEQRNVRRVQGILIQAEEEHVELTSAQLKVYQRSIECSKAEFNKHHNDIIAQSSPAERDKQEDVYFAFMDLYEEVSMVVESWLEKLSPALQSQPQPISSQPPMIIQPSLPIAIPTFDGRYEQWEKFKVMFRDVVDRTNEPDRIKLYHLEKALVGDAAGLIDAKTITDGNYGRAWQLLDERYSDQRRMVDRHLAGLLGVKKLGNESFSELRALVETFDGHVDNLKFLGHGFADVAEYMVVFLMSRALDDETKKLWESTIRKGELPTYEDTIRFLKERVSVLERCQTSTDDSQHKYHQSSKFYPPRHSRINTLSSQARKQPHCDFCGKDHLNFECPQFNEMSVSQRISKVKEKNLCFNCLRRRHRVGVCSSPKTCFQCQRRHHSLLHQEEMRHPAFPVSTRTSEVQVPVSTSRPSTNGASPNAAHSHVPTKSTHQVFLFTALINVMDKDQQPHPCRALLDCGSQASFITQSLADALRIPTTEVSVSVTGIGSAKSTIKKMGTVQVNSRYNSFTLSLSCLVSPKITGLLPSSTTNIESWEIPLGIQLADPSFHQMSTIDMLIGMDHFYDILKPGYLKLSDNLPALHDSHFGWLVGGNYCEGLQTGAVLRSFTVSSDPVEKLDQRYWEVESTTPEKVLSTKVDECERHFLAIHRPEIQEYNNLHDPEALTPAPIMIGRPLCAVPEQTYQKIPANRLSRWHVQQLREHFWSKRSKQYLMEVKIRRKWTQKRVKVKPEFIVVQIKENVPLQHWK
ncbi:uncharacterized protein LOC129753687 [Uranotaenia lowii]|uniref:uncharacterized protein LOC129753687 n=1 Tax=Uranotaenia lowii TaxID=190385 RepID=UPI002478D203|nr:uncharacterized protein LOC129753687 [Uranotaenia lowii]